MFAVIEYRFDPDNENAPGKCRKHFVSRVAATRAVDLFQHHLSNIGDDTLVQFEIKHFRGKCPNCGYTDD